MHVLVSQLPIINHWRKELSEAKRLTDISNFLHSSDRYTLLSGLKTFVNKQKTGILGKIGTLHTLFGGKSAFWAYLTSSYPFVGPMNSPKCPVIALNLHVPRSIRTRKIDIRQPLVALIRTSGCKTKLRHSNFGGTSSFLLIIWPPGMPDPDTLVLIRTKLYSAAADIPPTSELVQVLPTPMISASAAV